MLQLSPQKINLISLCLYGSLHSLYLFDKFQRNAFLLLHLQFHLQFAYHLIFLLNFLSLGEEHGLLMEELSLNLGQFILEYRLALHLFELRVRSSLLLKLGIKLLRKGRRFLIILLCELDCSIAIFIGDFNVMLNLVVDYLLCFIIFIAETVMIGLYIQFERLLHLVPKVIPSFPIGPVLLGEVEIETLVSIEREFFGRVRNMM